MTKLDKKSYYQHLHFLIVYLKCLKNDIVEKSIYTISMNESIFYNQFSQLSFGMKIKLSNDTNPTDSKIAKHIIRTGRNQKVAISSFQKYSKRFMSEC